jgi:hypothetical protein
LKNRAKILLVASACLVILFVTVRLTIEDTTARKVPVERQLKAAPETAVPDRPESVKLEAARLLPAHHAETAVPARPEDIKSKAGRLPPAHHERDEYSRLFAALPELTWSPEAVAETFAAKDDGSRHRQMLALLLDAPAKHQANLADHVANLTPDDDYAPIAWLITKRGVTGAALRALLEDLHERPADLKLPVMATILSQVDHPGAPGAEHALNVYLQVDHGYPSDAWRVAVETFLATGQ